MATVSLDHLEVISRLSHFAILDSLRELASHDRLTLGLREAISHGASIDDLSAASGLTPAEIKRRINLPLVILSDLDALTGVL